MEYYAAERSVTFTRIEELVRPISPRKDLIALWKIYRFLQKENPDIVHTHTSKAGTLGRAAALLAGVPAIFHTFHGSVFDGYFSPLKTWLFLAIERVLARFTDRVITVSPGLKKQLSDVYKIAPPDKIEVVRLGFDLNEFAGVAREKQRKTSGGNGGAPVIGWVGRFTEIKDPLLFVEFATTVRAAGVSAKFAMVGDGPMRSRIEQTISASGLRPDFSLLGWQRNMPQMYSGMDVLVSTSVNEGTPVTIIEGMATGCPFVAPDVGGLADLTKGTPQHSEGFQTYANGILVTRRDAQTLCRAVSSLLSDAQLRLRMGQAGRQFALDNFGEERLLREMELLYERCRKSRVEVPRHSLNSAESEK